MIFKQELKNFDDFVRMHQALAQQLPSDSHHGSSYPGSNLLSRPDAEVEDEEFDDQEPDVETGIQLLADDKVRAAYPYPYPYPRHTRVCPYPYTYPRHTRVCPLLRRPVAS